MYEAKSDTRTELSSSGFRGGQLSARRRQLGTAGLAHGTRGNSNERVPASRKEGTLGEWRRTDNRKGLSARGATRLGCDLSDGSERGKGFEKGRGRSGEGTIASSSPTSSVAERASTRPNRDRTSQQRPIFSPFPLPWPWTRTPPPVSPLRARGRTTPGHLHPHGS